MSKIKGDKIIQFVEAISSPLETLNELIYPLKTVSAELIINNKDNTHKFQGMHHEVINRLVLSDSSKQKISEMDVNFDFTLEIGLNDGNVINILVTDDLMFGKYAVHVTNAKGHHMFIKPEDVDKALRKDPELCIMSYPEIKCNCRPEDVFMLVYPGFFKNNVVEDTAIQNEDVAVKQESNSFVQYVKDVLTSFKKISDVLTEKGCNMDKLELMLKIDHYSEGGATELKLDVIDIAKYEQEIIGIAGEKPWVKLEAKLPIVFSGGSDVIRVYIYEDSNVVCVDYWSEKDTEMFQYVGPKPKGTLFNKPCEGGSYEGNISLLSNIIHPDWLAKTARTDGSLMDIIKGI